MSRGCAIDGCDRVGKLVRGMCGTHYHYWLDHTPKAVRPRAPRFDRQGDVSTDKPAPDGSHYASNGYLLTSNPTHPLAWASGVVPVHRAVLYDAIGPGTHPCHWCGVDITWEVRKGPGALEADHLNAIRSDNRRENLVPSCAACNRRRAIAFTAVLAHQG